MSITGTKKSDLSFISNTTSTLNESRKRNPTSVNIIRHKRIKPGKSMNPRSGKFIESNNLNQPNKRNQRNQRNKPDRLNKLNKLSPLDSRLLITLEKICLAQRKHLWKQALKYELSPLQIQILLSMFNKGPNKSQVSLLAEELGLTQASVSEAVGNLEKKGCVFKKRSDKDGRVFFIELSPVGLKTVKKLSFWPENVESKLTQLSQKEKKEALSVLIKIMEEAEKKRWGMIDNFKQTSSPKGSKITPPGDRKRAKNHPGNALRRGLT